MFSWQHKSTRQTWLSHARLQLLKSTTTTIVHMSNIGLADCLNAGLNLAEWTTMQKICLQYTYTHTYTKNI